MKNLDKLKQREPQSEQEGDRLQHKDRKHSHQQGLEDTPKMQTWLSQVYSPIMQSKIQQDKLVIGVCGGHSSGKIYFAEMLRWYLNRENIETMVIKQENFEADQKEKDLYERVDWGLMIDTLHVARVDVVIVEGTLIQACKEMRQQLQLKIFLDTDDDIRLSRRIYKDVYTQDRTVQQSVERYLKELKPLFEKYVQPNKNFADIIIPNYGEGYSEFLKIEGPDQPFKGIRGFATVDNPILDVLIKNVMKIIEDKRTNPHETPEDLELQ